MESDGALQGVVTVFLSLLPPKKANFHFSFVRAKKRKIWAVPKLNQKLTHVGHRIPLRYEYPQTHPSMLGRSENPEASDSAHTSVTWALNKMPLAPWALTSPVARGTQSCRCLCRRHSQEGWEEGGASLPMTMFDPETPAPCSTE